MPSSDGSTPMIKTLTPLGEGLGIVIDQTLLDQLHIERDTPLRVTTDEKGLYIEPIRVERRSRFLDAGGLIAARHGSPGDG